MEEKVYLYSLWPGRLGVYEGVMNRRYSKDDTTVFHTLGKIIWCSLKPGIVYNKTVWLPERNDEKAKKILIEYEENMVSKLQEKINNHLHIIDVIKNS